MQEYTLHMDKRIKALILQILSRLSLTDGVKNRMEPGATSGLDIIRLFEDAVVFLSRNVDCGVTCKDSHTSKTLSWRPGEGLYVGNAGLPAKSYRNLGAATLAQYVPLLKKIRQEGDNHSSRARALALEAFSRVAFETEETPALVAPEAMPRANKKALKVPQPPSIQTAAPIRPAKSTAPPLGEEDEEPGFPPVDPGAEDDEVLGDEAPPAVEAPSPETLHPQLKALAKKSAKALSKKDVANGVPSRSRSDVPPDAEGAEGRPPAKRTRRKATA